MTHLDGFRPRLRWGGGPGGWTAETAPPSLVDWRGVAVDMPTESGVYRWTVEAADMTDPDPGALCVLVCGIRRSLIAAQLAAEAAAGV